MICLSCPNPITARSKSGLCRPCCARRNALAMNRNPAFMASVKAGVARYFADPENRARRSRDLRARFERMTPAEMEERREWGRHLHREYLMRPDIIAKRNAPEVRAIIAQKNTDRALAWCPPDRRAEYFNLIAKKFKSAEARAIIEETIPGTVAYARRHIANANDARAIMRDRAAVVGV